MRPGARALRLAAALAVLLVPPRPPCKAQEPTLQTWEVTFAIRIADATGGPFAVRVALPEDSPAQRVTDIRLVGRDLAARLVTNDAAPHALFEGTFSGARRVSLSWRVRVGPFAQRFPRAVPVDEPVASLLPHLGPTRLLQSRSLLVRDFLEKEVSPIVAQPNRDLLRTIHDVTRRELRHRIDGKSLVLDVLRTRHGKRIGIERAFVTFLRCARIPARFVEGVNLGSSTRRKRTFWTEVWAEGRWWPISASHRAPRRREAPHVALARDGARVVHVDGPVQVSYTVEARRLDRPEAHAGTLP